MLAAVSGLTYTLGSLLKVESYLAYFLPLPAVLAAMRSGPAAGRKAVTATAFLVLGAPRPVCCQLSRGADQAIRRSSRGAIKQSARLAGEPIKQSAGLARRAGQIYRWPGASHYAGPAPQGPSARSVENPRRQSNPNPLRSPRVP